VTLAMHGRSQLTIGLPEVSGKLILMRGRVGFAWAIAGSASLAFLLVLTCHPGFPVLVPAGMSAPPAPIAAIESAPVAQFLQSHPDGHGLALRALSLSFALVAFCATRDAQQGRESHPPHYGPLHRRPPPSFS
jgi:hypothetical protein